MADDDENFGADENFEQGNGGADPAEQNQDKVQPTRRNGTIRAALNKGVLLSKRNVTSKVWGHFKVYSVLPNFVNCNICKKDLDLGPKFCTSTI